MENAGAAQGDERIAASEIGSGRLLSKPLPWYQLGMNRQDILDRLRKNERALRERGVMHAALFGSAARGEQRQNSDIDILVDLDPDIVVTIFDYAGVKEYISGMFDAPVDVVSREGLKPQVRPRATADAIYAF